jgi:transcriptional regulator NrdR family protein
MVVRSVPVESKDLPYTIRKRKCSTCEAEVTTEETIVSMNVPKGAN